MLTLLTGMHRSGTSALAQVMLAFGYSTGDPDDLMPATDANPLGYFELLSVVALNDDLLSELGGGWNRPPDPSADIAAFAATSLGDRARALLQSLECDRLLLKDPRFCLTLPFWQAIVGSQEIRVVSTVRHPAEVAASLEARDGLDRDYSLLLWERYNRQLITHAPGSLVVHHRSLLQDPVASVAELAGQLAHVEIDDAQLKAAAHTVDSQLWRAKDAQVLAGETAARLWELMSANNQVPLDAGEPDPAHEVMFRAVRSVARTAAASADDMRSALAQRLEVLEARLEERNVRQAELQDAHAALTSQRQAEHRQRLDELNAAFYRARSEHRAALVEVRAEHRAVVQRRQDNADRNSASLEAVTAELVASKALVDELRSELTRLQREHEEQGVTLIAREFEAREARELLRAETEFHRQDLEKAQTVNLRLRQTNTEMRQRNQATGQATEQEAFAKAKQANFEALSELRRRCRDLEIALDQATRASAPDETRP